MPSFIFTGMKLKSGVTDYLHYFTNSLDEVASFEKYIPSEAFTTLNGLIIGGDYLADLGIVMYQLLHLSDTKHLKYQKSFRSVYNYALENIHTGGKLSLLLSQHGVINGLAATIVTPAAGFAPAIMLWGRAIESYYDLYREVQLYDDADYWLDDRLGKLAEAEAQFIKLNEKQAKLKKTDDELQDKIVKLEQTVAALQSQVRLFVIDKFQQEPSYSFSPKVSQKFERVMKQELTALRNETLSETEKQLLTELKANQREKVIDKAINAVAWSTAAVGMTLLAVAPFAGPAAPALVVSGIAIAATAGLIKLGATLISHTVNYAAKDALYENEHHKLLVQYKTEFDGDILKDLNSYEEKLGYLLYAQQQMKMPKPGMTALSYYNQLGVMPADKRRKLIKSAIKEKIDRIVVAQIFKLNGDDDLEVDKVMMSLTRKQLKSMVHRKARHEAMHRVGAFFSSGKENRLRPSTRRSNSF